MEQLKIEMTYIFKDGKPNTKKTVSLWHGYEPFAFADDPNLKAIVVNGNYYTTPEEYRAFINGVDTVRNFLVSFVNR